MGRMVHLIFLLLLSFLSGCAFVNEYQIPEEGEKHTEEDILILGSSTMEKIEKIEQARPDKLPPKVCRFCDLPKYTWFTFESKGSGISWLNTPPAIYQKLPNLNGSNAYMLYRGYRYICRNQPVVPVKKPQFEGVVEETRNKKRAILKLYDTGVYEWVGSGVKA